MTREKRDKIVFDLLRKKPKKKRIVKSGKKPVAKAKKKESAKKE